MPGWFFFASEEQQQKPDDMCFPFTRQSSTPSYSCVNNENPYHCITSPAASSSSPAPTSVMPPHPMSPFNPAYNVNGSQLSQQHERLILELLPFKDSKTFHSWLAGDYVRGSWLEFRQDCLLRMSSLLAGGSGNGLPGSFGGEPDKHKTSQAAKDAISSRKPKYLLYHPDKSAWTIDDHHVRFIATVVADNMLQGLWSESEWKKKAIDITKAVFEVLAFLKAVDAVDKEPPRVSTSGVHQGRLLTSGPHSTLTDVLWRCDE